MFSDVNLSALAREADTLLERLFPICRSITGEGVRETLRVLSDEISSFQTVEVPSGTQCYDWKVPDEWNVREAFIADSNGNRLVDFSFNNVHLVSYSEPIDRLMSFAELDQHLYTLPKLPGAIPYRTAYYKRGWGFCLRHEQYETLDRNAEYHVKIDASFHQGGLTYGEALLHGTSGQEFLISSYCCHPSLANDNLSGLILWA